MAVYPTEEQEMEQETTVTRQTFGFEVPPSTYRPLRDCLAVEERTTSGNVPVRVGRENDPGQGWSQTAYVVLTPTEAAEMGRALSPERDRYAVLAQARNVLKALEEVYADGATPGHGRAAQACRDAEWAVFTALNTAAHYADDERAGGILDA